MEWRRGASQRGPPVADEDRGCALARGDRLPGHSETAGGHAPGISPGRELPPGPAPGVPAGAGRQTSNASSRVRLRALTGFISAWLALPLGQEVQPFLSRLNSLLRDVVEAN